MPVQVVPKSIGRDRWPLFYEMYHQMREHPELIDPFYDFIEMSLKMAGSMRTYDNEHQALVEGDNALRAWLQETQKPLVERAERFNKWVEDYHSPVSVEHANAAAKLMDEREKYYEYTVPVQNKSTQD